MVREEIVFGHDKCLCMRAYVEHRRVDTQQAQEPIGTVKCGESCSCPWQPRPRKTILLSKQEKVAWDSQTRISEPDRHTNEQGVDDSDDDDIDSDSSTARQDQH